MESFYWFGVLMWGLPVLYVCVHAYGVLHTRQLLRRERARHGPVHFRFRPLHH